MTRFEMIKAMPIEQLSMFLFYTDGKCDFCAYKDCACLGGGRERCIDGIKDWLGQEADNDI